MIDKLTSFKQNFASNAAAYFLLTAVSLTCFFVLWRIILFVITYEQAADLPGAVIFGSFIVGLRFDFSIACYITMLLSLIGMIPFIDISRNKIVRQINHWLLYLITAVVFIFHLGDIEFFKFFNSRLSGAALLWKESPDYMLGLIWETYPVVQYLLLYLVMLAGFIFLIRKLAVWQLDKTPRASVLTNSIWLIVIIILFAVGGRGRIEQRAPLRWGVAYFSPYTYANLLALNPTFTFTRDAIYDAGSKEHVQKLMTSIKDPEAEKITRDLLGISDNQIDRIKRQVTFQKQNPNPPNVIVIVMESFGAATIGELNNIYPYDLSPCFDSLANEGVLFTNFYSGGMHTFSGLFSVGYGYPHMFGDLVMKEVSGQNHFSGLPHILKDNGYHTQFYTTHDPHFDNMQGFLMANGVEKVYSLDDYGVGQELSINGVPDHVMFDFAAERFKELNDEPYCAIILSGSNHGPWVIPEVPFEKVPAGIPKELELNAFKYSDWSLGRFVRKLQADPSFNNTLIVVTADNGNAKVPVSDMSLGQYHIPLLLLWLGEDKLIPSRINTVGSHLDIVATVMGQVKLDYTNYTFGHDLLDTSYTGTAFAHFTEWYRQGYIENDYYCITRINGPESLYRLSDLTTNIADSLPELVEEYRQKSLAVYQTAYFNMRKSILAAQQDPTVIE